MAGAILGEISHDSRSVKCRNIQYNTHVTRAKTLSGGLPTDGFMVGPWTMVGSFSDHGQILPLKLLRPARPGTIGISIVKNPILHLIPENTCHTHTQLQARFTCGAATATDTGPHCFALLTCAWGTYFWCRLAGHSQICKFQLRLAQGDAAFPPLVLARLRCRTQGHQSVKQSNNQTLALSNHPTTQQ